MVTLSLFEGLILSFLDEVVERLNDSSRACYRTGRLKFTEGIREL